MNCTSTYPTELLFVGADIQKITLTNNTCLQEFEKGIGGGQTILYNVNGFLFANYFFVVCGNESSNFEFLPGRYFSEKSCCAFNEYFDFDTKTCEKLKPSKNILKYLPGLQNHVGRNGTSSWINKEPEKFIEFRSRLSEIVKNENIIEVSVTLRFLFEIFLNYQFVNKLRTIILLFRYL